MAKPEQSNPESGASAAGSELARLRERIDAVDRAILERLNQRAKWVLEVGHLKQSRGASVYEEAREKRIVSSLVESNPALSPTTAWPRYFEKSFPRPVRSKMAFRLPTWAPKARSATRPRT